MRSFLSGLVNAGTAGLSPRDLKHVRLTNQMTLVAILTSLFALFDPLGLQFSPRIRDLGDQRQFRLDREKRHPPWVLCSRGGSTASGSCGTEMSCCGSPGR